MSTAQLRSRLESIFEELEKESLAAPDQSTLAAHGWVWQCDPQGNFISCGKEVEAVLGYPADEFLGKPLESFHLHPSSSSRLKAALQAGKFPIDIDLQYYYYKDSQTGLIPVNLHIFSPSVSLTENGLRGFTQVAKLIEEKETLHQPPTTHYSSYGQIDETPPLASSSKAAALTVPIQLEEQARGLLEIVDDDPQRIWTEDERRLVEQVADQLSLALENARLFQAERKRASELDRLVELSRLISQNLELEEVYAIAHRIIGQLMPTEAFFINLLDKPCNEFISSYGVDRAIRVPIERFPIESGFSGKILRSGLPLLIQDLSTEPVPFPDQPAPGSSQWVRSLIAVPLRFSGEIIGALSTQSYQAKAFIEHDLKLLETFADHIAIAIQNARLFEQTQRTLAETEILYQASAELNAVHNFSEILTILCKSTLLGHYSATNVAINTFATPWNRDASPISFKTVASWSINPEVQSKIIEKLGACSEYAQTRRCRHHRPEL
jgi:GAF domain-containing protein